MKEPNCAPLLTIEDVCSKYKICRQTVYRYRKEHLITAINVGKTLVRFNEETLQKEFEKLTGRQTA